MRKLLPWVGGALVSMSLGVVVVQSANAVSTPPANSALASYVNPSSLAPKRPHKVTLTAATSACQQLSGKGLRVRLSCTTDCAWDAALEFPDAGFGIPYGDGGFGVALSDGGFVGTFAETADGNQLPSATPEYTALPPTLDSICAYSTSAGTLYVSETY